MTILLTIIIVILVAKYLKQKKITSTIPTAAPELKDPEAEAGKEKLPIAGAYQKKWLLTYNEKAAYKILKQICDKNNLHLMTKVRLLDIVEPVWRIYRYKTYLYKIQAKHVDFVICDEKLVARCIIELDDNSHDQEERMERDRFVDRVLESVGYQVLRTRNVTEDIESEILKTIPSAIK